MKTGIGAFDFPGFVAVVAGHPPATFGNEHAGQCATNRPEEARVRPYASSVLIAIEPGNGRGTWGVQR